MTSRGIFPKDVAEAGVRKVDTAGSDSKFSLNVEDWSASELRELIKCVKASSDSSRAELRVLRAGGAVFSRLGLNPRTGYGKIHGVEIVPHGNFDMIEFDFRRRAKGR